jgi:hypothetical protein
VLGGRTQLQRWTWNHVLLVRDEQAIRVFLNGAAEAEMETQLEAQPEPWVQEVFFGGSSQGDFNWEGKLDEIAIFPRALDAAQLQVEN